MKKILKIIGIIILILFIFRGIIFRSLIVYNEIGVRPEIEIINEHLIEIINSKLKNRVIDAKTILEIANEITTDKLSFSTAKVLSNPNDLIITNQANCVGYSTMFNSISNYIIRKNKLQSKIKAEHKIGLLYMFGINIHQYLKSSFFKDHDYNVIINIMTGEKMFIDPSVNDMFWIERISCENRSANES